MTEWRPIPSFPMYEANNKGEIKHRGSTAPLSLYRHKNGYMRAHVRVNGRMVYPWAHRLVCEAFHGPAPDGDSHAAHQNGIKTDNRPENLAWSSPKENRADQRRHGTELIGEHHANSKLTANDIIVIRALAGIATQREIGERFGIHEVTVGRIIRRERYRNIPEGAKDA